MSTSQAVTAQPPRTLLLRPEDLRPHPAYSAPESENAIIRLTHSIKKYGLLHPLAVRPLAAEEGEACYEIVDGHRRYRAALLAEIDRIPCKVLSHDDPMCVKVSLIIALKTQHLHFLDQADAFQDLVSNYEMKQEEVARYTGLSQSAVANKLRLLQLEEPLRQRLRSAALTERHARALLRVSPEDREAMLELFVSKAASVAVAERLVERYLSVKANNADHPRVPDPAPIPTTPPQARSLTPPAPAFSDTASGKELALCPATPLLHEATISSKPVVPALSDSIPAAPKDVPDAPAGSPAAPVSRPIKPTKFAIRDLRPLFNSIDRSLEIFRKTGARVECERQENAQGTLILIRIPKQNPQRST